MELHPVEFHQIPLDGAIQWNWKFQSCVRFQKNSNPLDENSSGFLNSSVPFGNTNSTGKSTVSNLGFYLKLKQWIFQWISLDAGFRWMRTEI
jgi:outer membrane receptor protein involved in Fe transport